MHNRTLTRAQRSALNKQAHRAKAHSARARVFGKRANPEHDEDDEDAPPPERRIGEWIVESEVHDFDHARGHPAKGYWVREAKGARRGYLKPEGGQLKLQEQLDLFAARPSHHDDRLFLAAEKPKTAAQMERERRKGQQFGMFENPRRNPDVLSGAIRHTARGAVVRTYDRGKGGKRKAVDIHLPAAIAALPDWRLELAHRPRHMPKIPANLQVSRGPAPAAAPAPSPMVQYDRDGNPVGTAALADGSRITYQWAVVPLASMVTSHDPWSLTASARFPQELQPRDRTRGSYEDQIRRLVHQFDPTQLFLSANVQDGAPIVGPDGIVESGNGRTMALCRVFRDHPDKARQYEHLARAWAAHLGLQWPPKGRDLVLVRIRTSDVNRAAFTRTANVAGMQQLAAGEQALADAGQMTAAIVDLYDPTHAPGTLANQPFVEAFIQHVAGSQARGDLTDAAGRLSQSGEARIRFALFAKAYGLEAETLISALAEHTDSGFKRILSGMLEVAPQWASLRAAIARGKYAQEYDMTSAVIAMAMLVRRARAANVSVESQRAQKDFANPVSVAADLLALAAHPMGTDNAIALASTLLGYASRVRKSGGTEQGGMFGEAPPPAMELLRRAVVEVVMTAHDETPISVRPATALRLATRFADPASLQLWPGDWREALARGLEFDAKGLVWMKNRQGQVGWVHRDEMRASSGKAKARNPGGPALPVRLPARFPVGREVIVSGHRVRDLGGGYVVVDGVRYRR